VRKTDPPPVPSEGDRRTRQAGCASPRDGGRTPAIQEKKERGRGVVTTSRCPTRFRPARASPGSLRSGDWGSRRRESAEAAPWRRPGLHPCRRPFGAGQAAASSATGDASSTGWAAPCDRDLQRPQGRGVAAVAGCPEGVRMVLSAVLLQFVGGPVPPAVERFGAPVLAPPAPHACRPVRGRGGTGFLHDACGPGPGPGPARARALRPSAEGRTAPHPAACPRAWSGQLSEHAAPDGGAGIHGPGYRRPIEGRGTWTYR
jgi:hypothetical protein